MVRACLHGRPGTGTLAIFSRGVRTGLVFAHLETKMGVRTHVRWACVTRIEAETAAVCAVTRATFVTIFATAGGSLSAPMGPDTKVSGCVTNDAGRE